MKVRLVMNKSYTVQRFKPKYEAARKYLDKVSEITVKKPSLERKWAVCTVCGSKSVIYDNTAECSGVFIKCQRGCKCEYELIIRNGQQITGKLTAT